MHLYQNCQQLDSRWDSNFRRIRRNRNKGYGRCQGTTTPSVTAPLDWEKLGQELKVEQEVEEQSTSQKLKNPWDTEYRPLRVVTWNVGRFEVAWSSRGIVTQEQNILRVRQEIERYKPDILILQEIPLMYDKYSKTNRPDLDDFYQYQFGPEGGYYATMCEGDYNIIMLRASMDLEVVTAQKIPEEPSYIVQRVSNQGYKYPKSNSYYVEVKGDVGRYGIVAAQLSTHPQLAPIRLIQRQYISHFIKSRPKGLPILLAGDFSQHHGGEDRVFPASFKDAFEEVGSPAAANFTVDKQLNPFQYRHIYRPEDSKKQRVERRRADKIFYSNTQLKKFGILGNKRGENSRDYMSAHFGVFAEFQLQGSPPKQQPQAAGSPDT